MWHVQQLATVITVRGQTSRESLLHMMVFAQAPAAKRKRATRGYQSDYEDRSRQWEDHKASGPAKEKKGVSEAVAVAEVVAVENRDKNNGRAAAISATYTASAHSAWDSPAAFRSRFGEPHRQLSNRKGSGRTQKRTTGRTT